MSAGENDVLLNGRTQLVLSLVAMVATTVSPASSASDDTQFSILLDTDPPPLVFHHGWPLSADDWDTQLLYFLGKGYADAAMGARVRSAQAAHFE